MLAKLFFLIVTTCAFTLAFADDQSAADGKAALDETRQSTESMTPGQQASELIRQVYEIQSQKYGVNGLQQSSESCFQKEKVKTELARQKLCFIADAVTFWMFSGKDGQSTTGLRYFDLDSVIAREVKGRGPELEKAVVDTLMVLAVLEKAELIKGVTPSYSERVKAIFD